LPLRIKLGLMKNFVDAMKKRGKVFKYLSEKFLKLDGKLKEFVFIGPQIHEIWSIWTPIDRNWEICMANIQEGFV